MDGVCHGAGRQFLTCVADHVKPRIVRAAPVAAPGTLQGFFDQLTDAQRSVETKYNRQPALGQRRGEVVKGTHYSLLKDPANQTRPPGSCSSSPRL